MLSDEHIKQFQTIYRQHFGKEISHTDVINRGPNLVRLVELAIEQATQQHEQETDSPKARDPTEPP